MIRGVWQVLASPADDENTSYLVSYYSTREEAYARRDALEKTDASTIFTVLMVILSDDEWARENGARNVECCNGVPLEGQP
jgi:hypothetical protein